MARRLPTITEFADVEFAEKLLPVQREALAEIWNFKNNRRRAVLAWGRRSGKSYLAIISALYVSSVLADVYRGFATANEPIFSILVSATERQATALLDRCKTMIEDSRYLKPLMLRSNATEIEFRNGFVIQSLPASSRAARGNAIAFFALDEAAFFGGASDDSNASAQSIYQALSPSMIQFEGRERGMIMSNPNMEGDFFHNLYLKAIASPDLYYASNMGTRAVRTDWDTTAFDQAFRIDADLLGEQQARAEYEAQFRSRLNAFLDEAKVDGCVNYRREAVLAPNQRFLYEYYLAVDPASGAQNRDAYAASIVHYEPIGDGRSKLVVDLAQEFLPTLDGQVDIAAVEEWVLEMHRAYRFRQVTFDQFESMGSIQRLKGKCPAEKLHWNSTNHMTAYAKLQSLITTGLIELPPHPRLLSQLKSLQLIRSSTGLAGKARWNARGVGTGSDDLVSALAANVLVSAQLSMSVFYNQQPVSYWNASPESRYHAMAASIGRMLIMRHPTGHTFTTLDTDEGIYLAQGCVTVGRVPSTSISSDIYAPAPALYAIP